MQLVPVKTGHTIGLFPKKTSDRAGIRKVEEGKTESVWGLKAPNETSDRALLRRFLVKGQSKDRSDVLFSVWPCFVAPSAATVGSVDCVVCSVYLLI